MIFYRFSNDISNIFLYLHCMDRTELRSSSEKISKFKRAWQVQISRYTHVTLRKYAFLKNNQMILVSFSCIFNTSLKITSVCSTNTLSSPCTYCCCSKISSQTQSLETAVTLPAHTLIIFSAELSLLTPSC